MTEPYSINLQCVTEHFFFITLRIRELIPFQARSFVRSPHVYTKRMRRRLFINEHNFWHYHILPETPEKDIFRCKMFADSKLLKKLME